MSNLIPSKISGPAHDFVKKHHSLRRNTYKLYKSYISLMLKCRKHKANLIYDMCIDPFRLFWISPDDIKLKMTNVYGKDYSGMVIGGDWDKDEVEKIDDYDVFIMIRNHFVDGVPWEETKKFQEFKETVESGGICWHNCGSVEDLKSRCESLDDLYNSIASEGFREPHEIYSEQYSDPIRNKSLERYPLNLQTISINIGRSGNPILDDGRHRLSIAKILDVDKIPVSITVRHKDWQQKRCKHARGEINYSHFDMHS